LSGWTILTTVITPATYWVFDWLLHSTPMFNYGSKEEKKEKQQGTG